jgi:hypothetical protein
VDTVREGFLSLVFAAGGGWRAWSTPSLKRYLERISEVVCERGCVQTEATDVL